MATVSKQFSRRKKDGKVESKKEKKTRTEKGKTGINTTSKLTETKIKKGKDLPKVDLGSKQGKTSKALDLISAPLSQPKTTLTQGFKAGAEEVKKSREKIQGGDFKEAAKSIATTAGTTAAAAGAITGAASLASLTTSIPTTTGAAAKTLQSGFAAQKAITGASYTATKARAAIQATSGLGNMAINSKTIGLTKSFLMKRFSGKAMALYGSWASSVILGRWGQAEAPESIMIPIRELIEKAETPEDWGIVEEHLAVAEELSNTTVWEDILLWSPFSAVKGIKDKVRGVAEGTKILRETAEKAREEKGRLEDQGESDFAAERRASDEDKRQRELEQRAQDSEYFRLIREKKYDEAEELLNSQLG